MRTVDGVVTARRQLGGFGTVVEPPAPRQLNDAERLFLQQKMNATVLAVRAAFRVAEAKVAVTPNSLVGSLLSVVTGGLSSIGITSAPTAVKTNVSNGLIALRNAFEQRIPPAMSSVLSGELEPDRWFAMVKPFVTGIKEILDVMGEYGTAKLMWQTVTGIGEDLAELTRKLKAGLQRTIDYMPVIVAVLGAVAVYALVQQLTAPVRLLSPSKRLSGYKRLQS